MRRQRGRARQQVARLRHEGRPCRGQGHAALRAIEQARADALLQLGDRLRERRLGDVQALRGAAEVQFLGHGEELAPQA